MPDIILDPDPASTIEASEEYIAAWHAAYGTGAVPPAPPEVIKPFEIDPLVLPPYLQEEAIEGYVSAEVAEALETYTPPAVVQEFQFVIADTLWVCNHTMQRRLVDVVTVDLNGNEVIGDVSFPDVNVVEISWDIPMTGSVRLST